MIKGDVDKMEFVLPLLPAEVRGFLESARFDEECEQRFTRLDTDKNGDSRTPSCYHSSSSSQTRTQGWSRGPVQGVAAVFDADGDKELDRAEFKHSSRFVLLASLLSEISNTPASPFRGAYKMRARARARSPATTRPRARARASSSPSSRRSRTRARCSRRRARASPR